jgi:tetratricopeptide (TPR) repeat protein
MGNVILLRSDPRFQVAAKRRAYALYCQASKLDDDPSTQVQAMSLYEEAIGLDPDLAIAYTNLANIHYRRGCKRTATALYERALALDSTQPEAHYNLGYLALEEGHYALAITHLEKAAKSDPKFADAHYNLALSHEGLGNYVEMARYFKTYLALEPQGVWSDTARRKIAWANAARCKVAKLDLRARGANDT